MLLPARLLVHLALALSIAACTSDPSAATNTDAARSAPVPAEPDREFNVIGDADAPVVIIEFTDLQCPYCAKFATQTFPRLRTAYIDTGKLRYASRDLPLPMHAFAVPAAVAARCAGEQGRFWEFRAAVFAEQGRLGTAPYDEFARRLGLDAERFAACRRDDRQLRLVWEDAQLAGSFGLDSTPSFVIGRVIDGKFVGDSFSGAKPLEFFVEKVDALLAQ
jgi:protein-disulfide isomerase